MLRAIIEALALYDYIGEDEVIQIAKGKYKLPTTIKDAVNHLKRN